MQVTLPPLILSNSMGISSSTLHTLFCLHNKNDKQAIELQLPCFAFFSSHDFRSGAVRSRKFTAFFVKHDKIAAVVTVNTDPNAAAASELLRVGKMPSATVIKTFLNKSPTPINLSQFLK